MSLFVGLTLCVSLWQIMLQQQQQEPFIDSTPILISLLGNESIGPSFISSTIVSNVSPGIQLELLPKNDFSQLIDLDNFEFLLNHQACRELEQKPILVIIVHSAPNNFNKRMIIRETWGTEDPRALLIFMIGAVDSSNLQDDIQRENKVHGDLVQGDFKDAYRNMTYKHVMALKWFVYNCPEARFLLKTDDDVFVNTPLLFDSLGTPNELYKSFNRGRLLFCNEVLRSKVKRSFRSKWRVSYSEYHDKYYPNHCPGFAILYSSDVVFQLYREAQKLPYFWIDDVHLTGNVATKLNISITPANSLSLNGDQQNNLLNEDTQSKDVPFLFALPNLGEAVIRKLWKLVARPTLRHDLNNNVVETMAT